VKGEDVISDYKKYAVHILVSDLENMDPEHVYIKTYINDNNGRILSIQKPTEDTPCPEPASVVSEWLESDWRDYRKSVVIRDVDETTGEQFTDSAKRVQMNEQWQLQRDKWIEEKKRLAQIEKVFKRFYSICNLFQQQSDSEELLYAFGVFQDQYNKAIQHPLFTKRLQIKYENVSDNIITLFNTEENIKFDEAFLNKVSNATILHMGDIVNLLGIAEFDFSQEDKTADFLTKVIHYLTPDGEYLPTGKKASNQHFIVTYSPMILVRDRTSGMVEYIDKVMEAIQGNVEIPAYLIDLLHPKNETVEPNDTEDSVEKRLAAVSGEDLDIFMTKPANKAQLRIAQDIEKDDAVEVQGPPGTGKTHTIANLIGHFLAQGKTILVTSEKIKALTVLRDKLDEEIRPLCVPVFDGNQSEMENDITSITSRVNQLREIDLVKVIDDEKKRRNEIINNLNDERKKIFNIRSQEAKTIVYDGQGYSVLEVAKLISENRELMMSIPGYVKQKEGLPLTREEFQQLYASNESISADEEYELSLPLPSYDELMVPTEFQRLLGLIETYAQKKKAITSVDESETQENFDQGQIFYQNQLLFTGSDKQSLELLLQMKEQYKPLQDWQYAIIEDCIVGGGYQNRWNTVIDSIDRFCDVDQEYEGLRIGQTIEFGEQADLHKLLQVLPHIQSRLKNGGSFGFFGKLFNSDVANALKIIRVNGHEMVTEQDVTLAISKVQRELEYNHMKMIWRDSFAKYDIQGLDEIQGNISIHLRDYKEKINQALSWKTEWYEPYAALLQKAGFSDSLLKPETEYAKSIHEYEQYLSGEVFDYIQLALIFSAEKKVREEINRTKIIFKDERLLKSNLCINMVDALEHRDSQKYQIAYTNFVRVFDKKTNFETRSGLLNKLAEYAFDWAQAIRKRAGKNGTSTVPMNLDDAWKFKQFDLILDDLYSESLEEREKRVDDYSTELRNSTAILANKMAWLHLKQRLAGKKAIQSALATYASLIKQAGKRTGKRAPQLLKQARECMLRGQKAVPAWIIPVRRALETFNPVRNHFDVAIIDEASQSSLEALAITFMASKIIVVGDDKQVSPMLVGIDFVERDKILQQYLGSHINNSFMFDGKVSFYELVGTVFKPLMLEEHFRCVPEIIGYSNEKMYDNKILPLRDSNSSKLLPPVINYRVDGARNGKRKTNQEEAEAVVSLMLACWEQPEYAGKTFGIISLLGDEQAEIISEMIYHYCGDFKEMQERNLITGNAASFQGDERDVMFLSMVDDNTTARTSQTLDVRRRYNVAVSRAKDQLWVVNSLDFNQLKHNEEEEDVKYGLLEYAKNYKAHRAMFLEVETKADSPFEVEVARYLLAQGYHIRQQYEVGVYRIDIVVIYQNKKIAIECDGERFHSGAAKIEADMERQCILQRLGWTFIRIRGGMYYRDKEGTMKIVMRRLNEYGIKTETAEVDNVSESANTSKLYERVAERARGIREGWHKERDEESSGVNAGTRGENHNGSVEIEKNNDVIEMFDKVKIQMGSQQKTYLMMKNSAGSATELAKACIGHHPGDVVAYQGMNCRIIEISRQPS
jgi:very-short-patch-repair endonuclease